MAPEVGAPSVGGGSARGECPARRGGEPASTGEGRTIDILAAAGMVARSQERVSGLLAGQISSGRLPPALLFAGPEGSGKELMAIELAARLNCGCPDPADRTCPACTEIGRLEHPDVHLIHPVPYGEWETALPEIIASRREDFFSEGEFDRKARSIGIDLVRHVIEVLSKHPYEGRRSVVAVFEAHLATVEAQNALLKLLEEPPPSAVIVLVTELPDRLLPTILSRCSEVRFDSLPVEAVASFLERFYAVETAEAARIALLSQGNLRRAARLLDSRFLGLWKDTVSALKLVIDGKGRELLAEAEGLAGRYTREEVGELLAETIVTLRLILRRGDGGASEAERLLLEEAFGAERLEKAAGRDIPADIRRVLASLSSLRRNADVELTVAQLLLDLTGKWY